jgi:hypothetical protein
MVWGKEETGGRSHRFMVMRWGMWEVNVIVGRGKPPGVLFVGELKSNWRASGAGKSAQMPQPIAFQGIK